MSIKALARDLYKAQQKVDGLQKQYDEAALTDRDRIKRELQIARKELEIMRNMLEGRKSSSKLKDRLQGFYK